MSIKIKTPGLLTTVQDGGRRGYQSGGYRECGAADKYSLAVANILVGNSDIYQAGLEMTLNGATLEFIAPAIFAVAGASAPLELDGRAVPVNAPLYAAAGSVLKIGLAACGLRLYLAVYGGIDTPPVLGSRSTDLACQLGGYEGRALKAGDILAVGAEFPAEKSRETAVEERRRILADKNRLGCPAPLELAAVLAARRFCGAKTISLLRAVLGPEDEYFTADALTLFPHPATVYAISPQSDRMGCRLSGPSLATKGGSDIISNGIVAGSVQVSSDGLPIIMQADHQTTGGYAKIATVISADLPALAQLRPGELVGFRFVPPAEGTAAARAADARLTALKERYL